MASNLIIVKIHNIERYKPFAKQYGVLQDSLESTAVINWDGNNGGICTNVAHEDYGVVSPDYWDIINGEVVINRYGGCIHTGLKIS